MASCLTEVRSSTYRAKLEEFIKAYRSEPCLWQVSNVHYYNRNERYAAINRLLVTYRKLVPAAEREDIQKKINSIRTVYKKEREKVKAAEKVGATRVPKLWCYNLMSFIDKDAPTDRDDDFQDEQSDDEGGETMAGLKEEVDDNEEAEHATLSTYHSDAKDSTIIPRAKKPRTNTISHHSNDTLHSDGNSECSSSDVITRREDEEDEGKYAVVFKEEIDNSEVPIEYATGHAEDPIEIPRPKKPKTYNISHRYSKYSNKRQDKPNPREGHRTEDRHDVYCKSIACKLRDLPKQQRLLAEKLINDVLFEAEWGTLTLTHKITQ